MSEFKPNGYFVDKNGQRVEIVDAEARNKVSALTDEIEEFGGVENAGTLLYVDNDGNVSNVQLGAGLGIVNTPGKNIVKEEWLNARFVETDGSYMELSSGISYAILKGKINVTPGETYTCSFSSLNGATWANAYVGQYTETGEYVGVVNLGLVTTTKKATFTVDKHATQIYFHLYCEGANWETIIPNEFMLEVGTEATAYEPYRVDMTSVEVDSYDSLMIAADYTRSVDGVIDVSSFVNAQLNGSGVFVPLSSGKSHAASPVYFSVIPGCTYDVDFTMNGKAAAYANFYSAMDENTYISKVADYDQNESIAFTTPETAKFVRFMFYSEGVDTANITPLLMKMEKSGTTKQDLKDRVIRIDRIDVGELHQMMVLLGFSNGQTIPDYYFANDYLNDKCERIAELYNGCAGNGDAFFFVTDQHWPLNAQLSPALMRYISEKVHIPRAFSGGDTADAASEDYANEMQKETGVEIHHAMGNHDYFSTVDGHQLARIFDAGKSNQIGNAYRHYYYVDNPQQQIRYIVLSAFDNVDGTLTSAYESEQITWLTSTALNVEEGWTVIVFTHNLYYGAESTETLYVWPDGADQIVSALDAAECDVACVIQGHMHLDRITHTPGGIPVVVTTCDKYQPWIDGGNNMEPYLSNRVAGTITEQAFDVVVLDKEQRKLTFVRIGAPADNWTDGTSTGTVEERVVTY